MSVNIDPEHHLLPFIVPLSSSVVSTSGSSAFALIPHQRTSSCCTAHYNLPISTPDARITCWNLDQVFSCRQTIRQITCLDWYIHCPTAVHIIVTDHNNADDRYYPSLSLLGHNLPLLFRIYNRWINFKAIQGISPKFCRQIAVLHSTLPLLSFGPRYRSGGHASLMESHPCTLLHRLLIVICLLHQYPTWSVRLRRPVHFR